jgi:hypothetical protein
VAVAMAMEAVSMGAEEELKKEELRIKLGS